MTRASMPILLSILILATGGCSQSGVVVGIAGGSGTVVYLADQDIPGTFEIYQATSGTKLNVPLVAGRTVTSFALTPDGTAVIYIADQDMDDVFELYRVNLANPGVSTKLNPAFVPAGTGKDVVKFAVTPDSSAVVYLADQTLDGVFELYRTVFFAGTNTKLNPPYGLGQDVDAFVILPNSTGVIYRADQDTDGVSELYRVLFATAPATDRLVSPFLVAGQSVGAFAATPDSANVVYIANRPIASDQVFIVPAAGGSNIQLNGALVANGNVTDFAVAPNGLSVVYRADQTTDEVFELYRVSVAAPGTSVTLNGLLVAGGDVTSFGIIPDSSGVVYIADQTTDEVFELFRTMFPGGNTQLNPPYGVASTSDVTDFALFPNGSGVVYRADQDIDGVNEIYRVVFGFPGTPKLNPALVAGQNVSTYAVAPDSASAIYRANQTNPAIIELYQAMFSSLGTSTQLNAPPLVPGRNVAGFDVR